MKRTTANLLLLMAGAIWGMGFVAQQTAMQDIGPMLFIGIRLLLAGLVVMPFAILERSRLAATSPRPLFSPAVFWRFILVGSVFFLGMAFQQIGLLTTTVTNAGFLTALYVIFVPLFLLIFAGERPLPLIWPAAAMALTGIFLLSGGTLSSLAGGDWLIILCATFWAWHVILTARVGQFSNSPVTMACMQFFVAGCLGLIFHYASALTPFAEASPDRAALIGALPEIVYAGSIAGGLAFTLQAVGQRYTSASAAAILLSTESLFAALFGAIFLGDMLPATAYVGCALIFAAILIVELAPLMFAAKREKIR